MSAEAFAAAVKALLPAGRTVYDGQAPDSATPPWTFATFGLPHTAERSLARTGTVLTVACRFLLYDATAKGSRLAADDLHAALEGARPVVDGWRTSPLERINQREPVADDRTIPGTNLRAMYGVVEYLFTASKTA